ncbi:MAG: stage III sporulation protein AC [Sarcina sp.]
MGLELIIKIAGIGILISVLNMILEQQGKREWSSLTTLGGVVIALGMVMTEVSKLFDAVRTMFQLY